MRQITDRFNEVWGDYKAKFGATFSYFDVVRDEATMKKAIPQMEAALEGKREAISDQEFGALPDDDALS